MHFKNLYNIQSSYSFILIKKSRLCVALVTQKLEISACLKEKRIPKGSVFYLIEKEGVDLSENILSFNTAAYSKNIATLFSPILIEF